MSDNDQQPGYQHEALFIEMIDASHTRDAGIALFEQSIPQCEEALRKQYIGTDMVSHDGLMWVEDELNARWPYINDIAVVSGRVYLVKHDDQDMAPSSWGMPYTDESDRTYYFVDEVRLRSHGVQAVPEIDAEDAMTLDIKIGYVYSLEEDDMEEPAVFAFPGELEQHQYETPTPAEAQLRLTRQWPEQTALIQKLIRPDLQAAAPRRLALLAGRLQTELCTSPEFRILAAILINDLLMLDKTMPYLMVVETQMDCYDGSDPADDDDPGMWMPIDIEQPITLVMYNPDVYTCEYPDGSFQFHFRAETYNYEDGDTPEYISVAAAYIQNIRSMRALRSIIRKALLAVTSVDERADDPQFGLKQADVDGIDSMSVSYHAKSELVQSGEEPEYVLSMKMLEDELAKVIRDIEMHINAIYSTEDLALNAAKELIDTYIIDRLVGAGVYNGYVFEFSGESVKYPRVMRSLPGVPHDPHTKIFKIDPNDPIKSLEPGDVYQGSITRLEPFAKEVRDDDNEVIGFSPLPLLIIGRPPEVSRLSAVGSSELAELTYDSGAMVPLDKSVGIKIRALERYRLITATLAEVSKKYDKKPIVGHMMWLHRAIQSSRPPELVELERVDVLHKIEYQIRQIISGEDTAEPVTDALRAMLVERTVVVGGDMYRWGADGLVFDAGYSFDEPSKATVIDVRDDIDTKGIYLVLEFVDDTFRYVPLRSIRGFRF
jgi:hypothetical protein